MRSRAPQRSTRGVPELIRVAAAIQRGLDDRGMRRGDIARACGVSEEATSGWLRARYLPSLDSATVMADLLDAPLILHFTRLAQVGTCRLCKAPFKKLHGARRTRREYCSTRCQQQWNAGSRAMDNPAELAIAAFCQGCEPEGICRTEDCVLRAFSPFVFVARRAA